MEKELTYNTVIVGAGVSGLYAALKLPKEQNILLICKEDLPSCDSMLAQGGICVQRDETDYDSFFEDTLKAGHYENLQGKRGYHDSQQQSRDQRPACPRRKI